MMLQSTRIMCLFEALMRDTSTHMVGRRTKTPQPHKSSRLGYWSSPRPTDPLCSCGGPDICTRKRQRTGTQQMRLFARPEPVPNVLSNGSKKIR